MENTKKQIVVIQTSFIGDVILTTPLLRRVKEIYKDTKLYFVIQPHSFELMKNLEFIDEIIVYDKRESHKGIKGFYRIVSILRQIKPDIVITPHRYFRSGLMTFLSGAKQRYGFDIFTIKFFYNKRRKYLREKGVHETGRNIFLLTGKEEDLEGERPSCPDFESIFSKFENLVEKYNYFVFAPHSVWQTKCWDKDYYLELAELVFKNFGKTVVLIGSDDIYKNRKLDKYILNFMGKTSLSESASLIEFSNLLVTNDSAPLHIASAYNIPTIAIFGPTVPDFGFYPLSEKSRVVEVDNLGCRPCNIHGKQKCPLGHHRCMRLIKPDDIFKVINQFFKQEDR